MRGRAAVGAAGVVALGALAGSADWSGERMTELERRLHAQERAAGWDAPSGADIGTRLAAVDSLVARCDALAWPWVATRRTQALRDRAAAIRAVILGRLREEPDASPTGRQRRLRPRAVLV